MAGLEVQILCSPNILNVIFYFLLRLLLSLSHCPSDFRLDSVVCVPEFLPALGWGQCSCSERGCTCAPGAPRVSSGCVPSSDVAFLVFSIRAMPVCIPTVHSGTALADCFLLTLVLLFCCCCFITMDMKRAFTLIYLHFQYNVCGCLGRRCLSLEGWSVDELWSFIRSVSDSPSHLCDNFLLC